MSIRREPSQRAATLMGSPGTRAVLLDAAGTLVQIEPPAPHLRAILLDRFGIEVTLEQAATAIHSEIAFYRAHMQEGSDLEQLGQLRGRCAGVLRAALPDSPELESVPLDQLTEALVAAIVFRPFAEVPEALARLRHAGLRLVVASNWDAGLEAVLARIGLRGLVDGVVCSAVVGVAKPDPRLLRCALALVGVGPGQAIHVGDSIEHDVAAAVAAGIRPILVDREGADPVDLAAAVAGDGAAGDGAAGEGRAGGIEPTAPVSSNEAGRAGRGQVAGPARPADAVTVIPSLAELPATLGL